MAGTRNAESPSAAGMVLTVCQAPDRAVSNAGCSLPSGAFSLSERRPSNWGRRVARRTILSHLRKGLKNELRLTR